MSDRSRLRSWRAPRQHVFADAAPGKRDDAWLPGLAEPVPDHPHFPKLVEAIRTMRERDAWLDGGRPAARRRPPPRSDPMPRRRWPLVSGLLLGIAMGSLTTLIVVQPRSAHLGDALHPLRAIDRPAGESTRATEVIPVELLGAGRAQAGEASEADTARSGPDAAAGQPEGRPLQAANVVRPSLPGATVGRPGQPGPAELNNKLGSALYELGQRQQAAGDIEAALESYKRSARLAPDQAQTFYDWGWLLQQTGDAAGAMDKYQATIEREPKHPFARYNIGYLLQSGGDVTGAQIVYENAVAAGAANAATLYNLGWLMQKAGDETSAMQHYEASLREDPDHALAHYNLGYLHERQGEAGLAAEHYRRALASDPGLPNAAERLRAVTAAVPPSG